MVASGRTVGGYDFCTDMAGGATVAGCAPDRGGYKSGAVRVSVTGSSGTGSCCRSFYFIERVANIGNINVTIGVTGDWC
jgi:hypothetical protein